MAYQKSVECPVEGPAEVPATFSEILNDYGAYSRRVRDLARETIEEQRVYLARFFAACSASSPEDLFASLTWILVQRFIFEYAQDHSPGSRRWMHFSLRGFLRFCSRRGYVSSDLSNAVPAFRSRCLSSIPRGIDDKSVRILLESIDPKSPLGLRDLAIIQILNTYGVRGIQVRRLRLDDVDWANSRILFRAVKGGKTVVQHLTQQVGNSLSAYIRDARPNSVTYAEIFLTSRPPFCPLSWSGSLSSIIARRLREVDAHLPEGVSRGTHSFRHAFASRLVGNFPLKYIADMLGHQDLSSSYIYTKVDFEALSQTALPWPQEVE